MPFKNVTLPRVSFSIDGLKTLPRVDVHYTTLGEDGRIIDAMIKLGAKGIVNAGLGHANVPNEVMNSLIAAKKRLVPPLLWTLASVRDSSRRLANSPVKALSVQCSTIRRKPASS